jgi:hypothetical protein
VLEHSDFPYWIRFAHFINIIFIPMLIRSCIEILSSLPKLYWKDDAIPGTEWIKFTKKSSHKRQVMDIIRRRNYIKYNKYLSSILLRHFFFLLFYAYMNFF